MRRSNPVLGTAGIAGVRATSSLNSQALALFFRLDEPGVTKFFGFEIARPG